MDKNTLWGIIFSDWVGSQKKDTKAPDLKNDFLGFKKAAQKYGKALFRCGAELSEISFVNYPAVAAKYATHLKYRERLEHN